MSDDRHPVEPPVAASPPDPRSAAVALEARLQSLRQQVASGTPVAAAATPPSAVPVDATAVATRVGELTARIAELVELRDYLEDTARDVVARFVEVLGDHPVPPALRADLDVPEPEPVATLLHRGEVDLLAGPFASIDDLDAFERLLRELPEATAARLAGLEGRNARFTLDLNTDLALADVIADRGPHRVDVLATTPGHLTLGLNRTDG